MRCMMLMIPQVYAGPTEPNFAPPADAVEKMTKYNEQLAKAGVLLSLDGLHPPDKGARVRFDGARSKVQDGPFTESKEIVGGFWMIQVKSLEEAIEWAKRIPAAAGDVRSQTYRRRSLRRGARSNVGLASIAATARRASSLSTAPAGAVAARRSRPMGWIPSSTRATSIRVAACRYAGSGALWRKNLNN